MNASLRYAYLQILRGSLNMEVPVVVSKIISDFPSAWSYVTLEPGVSSIDFRTNWPGRGVVRLFGNSSNYADVDITRRFLERYNTFMGVNRFGAKRFF